MANLLINGKEYTGVNEVQIPLADGSGNASFVKPHEQTFLEQWSNSVFTHIGEYDIISVAKADGSSSYYYLSQCGVDLYNARMASDEINLQKSGNVGFLVIPKSFDETVLDTIAIFGTVTTKSDGTCTAMSSCPPLFIKNNVYYSYVQTKSGKYTDVSDNANVGDMPLFIMTTSTDPVLTASKADLYMVGHPF